MRFSGSILRRFSSGATMASNVEIDQEESNRQTNLSTAPECLPEIVTPIIHAREIADIGPYPYQGHSIAHIVEKCSTIYCLIVLFLD